MARPKIKIDPEMVQKLAQIFCTMEEIAAVVGCSVDTLERRFADIIKKGKESAKASLRREQYKKAMDGNTTMMIWLGKQYLEQTDKINTTGELILDDDREMPDGVYDKLSDLMQEIGKAKLERLKK